MRPFLTKVALFFALLTMGLMALYSLGDPEHSTVGDIRYVKTRNLLTSSGQYDAVIIGSSRVFDLANDSSCHFHLFNYGIIQGMPQDYPELIAFAKKHQPVKKVIVALDFFGSSVRGLTDLSNSWKSSGEYIHDVTHETRLKMMGSYYDFARFKRFINYKLLASNPFTRGENDVPVENQVWRTPTMPIYESAYSQYQFNDKLPELYRRIKEACGDAQVIVYVTPESAPLFNLMIKKGLKSDYDHFLRTAVKSFGQVYNYMELNDMTKSPRYFKDENHLQINYLRQLVCERMNNATPQKIPATLLNGDNLENYIATMKVAE